MKDNSLIWVLADDRPGNYNQAIGIAENLDRPFEIKKIKYNFLAKLPNFLKFCNLIGVHKSSTHSLLNQKNPPQIIISAGRKTAPIALFLKNHYKNSLVIQIMNPRINFDKFDLIILPKHDQILEEKNIITSIGSLNRVDKNLLKNEYQKFSDKLDKINSPKILLLVGGSSKKGKFTQKVTLELAKICNNISLTMNANLLVTTSKRTDLEVIDDLKKSSPKSFFFQWQENKPNPYFAMLEAADYIIVTGDSMSMCSESCSTGKPTYIFNPAGICSPKHLGFHENLFAENFAKKLTADLTKLENYSPKEKLDETSRISKKINNFLVLKNF